MKGVVQHLEQRLLLRQLVLEGGDVSDSKLRSASSCLTVHVQRAFAAQAFAVARPWDAKPSFEPHLLHGGHECGGRYSQRLNRHVFFHQLVGERLGLSLQRCYSSL